MSEQNPLGLSVTVSAQNYVDSGRKVLINSIIAKLESVDKYAFVRILKLQKDMEVQLPEEKVSETGEADDREGEDGA